MGGGDFGGRGVTRRGYCDELDRVAVRFGQACVVRGLVGGGDQNTPYWRDPSKMVY